MAKYIEREAALIICEKEYQERVKMQDWCGDTVAWNIGHAIKAIQTADVVPVVHGRWEVFDDNQPFSRDDVLRCSSCKTGRYIRPPFLYCPNCGARMDGADE